MNGLISPAYAQATGAASGGQLAPLLMMAVFVVIFYFLLIRPQQKKAKEQQAMIAKLAAGDEVVTAGGMLGRIIEVGETFVTLEVSEGVRIKVQKFQVVSLVPRGTMKSA
ncbi:MAG: preprotein translocase subunit YajC [Steroidobacteraceae bacterium]